jgi:pimeloyl-ACP methyl ester carboxylesterase
MRRTGAAQAWPALAAALLLGTASAAADPSPQPCVPPPVASQATPPPGAARIAGAHYRCIKLPSGHALWVGLSGADATTGPPPPTVLLVHGLGPNAHSDWALTVPALAQRFRVVTVDLPGFGGSAPPPPGGSFALAAMAALLAELAGHVAPAERVHLVGHSLGAALALQTAHQHPQQVQRLVLVDAAGILLKPVFVQALARLQPPPVGLAPVDRLLGFLSDRANSLASLALLGHDQRADLMPLLQRYPAARQALVGGATQTDLALHLVEHDFSAAIRQTQAATTVLWGSLDRVAPLRTGVVLAARLPHARLQVLDGAGHTPMLDTPAAFNQALLQALANAPDSAGEVRADKPGAAAGAASQGHVVCRNTDGSRYSGRFDSLTLHRCGDVRIERAHIGRLVLDRSTVSLSATLIDSDDVALTADGSEITVTASELRGRVAIRAGNSWFDLAGVSLLATGGPAVEMGEVPSRLFLSVSDWQGSDHRGDAHFVWPRRR